MDGCFGREEAAAAEDVGGVGVGEAAADSCGLFVLLASLSFPSSLGNAPRASPSASRANPVLVTRLGLSSNG